MGRQAMFDMAVELENIRSPVHIERLCHDDYPDFMKDQPRCFVVIRVENDRAHTTSHDLTVTPNIMIIKYDSGGKIIIRAIGLTSWHWSDKDGAMRIDDGQH